MLGLLRQSGGFEGVGFLMVEVDFNSPRESLLVECTTSHARKSASMPLTAPRIVERTWTSTLYPLRRISSGSST